MKTSKFTEAQIAFILRQAEEGTPIAEVCRKAGISDAFCNRRERYGGMMPSEVKRMRRLEEENNRLKISRDQASRPTMHSSSRSTADPGRSA